MTIESDIEFAQHRLIHYRRLEAEYRAKAALAQGEDDIGYYQRMAERAAAYAADYEQELSK